MACGPQSSPGPALSCLSSQGFGLGFERVTSKRTCLPRAQPDQGRLLLGQIPGGWGQRPHCSPNPQTPPNALGIRSLSFPSSALYRPQLFATGSSPGPSFRRGWGTGGGGQQFPLRHHHTPLGHPGALELTSGLATQLPPCPATPKPCPGLRWHPPSPILQNHSHPPPGSLPGLPLLRGASQPPNHSSQLLMFPGAWGSALSPGYPAAGTRSHLLP